MCHIDNTGALTQHFTLARRIDGDFANIPMTTQRRAEIQALEETLLISYGLRKWVRNGVEISTVAMDEAMKL